jgi:Kef-type K+ transport system membrane component KefB
MKIIISEMLLAVTIPAGLTIILHLIFHLSAQECFSLGMLLGVVSGGIWMKSGRLSELTAKLSALYKEWL